MPDFRQETAGAPAEADGPNHAAMTLAIICAPMFLVLLDVTVVNVALPSIGSGVRLPPGRWAWIVDAYTVPLAVTLLLGGVLTDKCGFRTVLLGGIGAFTVGSIGCADAGTWQAIVTFRALQGLGAAAMLPAGLSALTTVWTDRVRRARALGIWSAVSAAATALGPVIGGLLLAWGSWRLVFALNVPVCALAAAGAAVVLPRCRGASRPASPMPARRRPLAGATLTAFLMTTVGNGTLIAVTVYLQHGLKFSPLDTGLMMLVATVPFAGLGPITGRLMARFGRRVVACSGFTAGAVLIAALARVDGAGPWLVAGLLGIGIGLGLMTAPIVGEGMAGLPGAPGLAGGINNTARQLGTSTGVAAAGTVMVAGTLGEGLRVVGLAECVLWLAGGAIAWTMFARRSD
ncbi:MFS transporter [Spelaeicoccus albus]|uniref:DHA2 family methylenomycin A resistance protein-like MFS transporter n=1 Tax=Spelaeicoccus albus TaxID=1280376 RepID=A0A7Z0IHB1_9MICO|nr:MFS transporter [Spelaeicoccus albus]NYI67536.1 DHA2 family methylenomycin A resistance protein-like MFS transporter [Spelaeicoccus albus]